MARVILTSVAEDEFASALSWYAARSLEAANAFDAAVDSAISAIKADPQRFPCCDDRHHYYLLQRFPYQVIYRTVGSDILVIAIAHTARNPEFWTGR